MPVTIPLTEAFFAERLNPSKRRKAIKAARRVEQGVYDMGTDALAQLRRDLEVARDRVIVRLATSTKAWEQAQLTQLKAELEASMQAWAKVTSTNLANVEQRAWEAGLTQTEVIAKSVGVDVALFANIDNRLLALTTATAPDLITNVSAEVVNSVSSILRQAALGQLGVLDVMRKIGSVTGSGPFASATYRGEVIYRTEMGRLFQQANYAKTQALAASNPEWRKEWIASEDSRVRPAHARAHGQRVPVDEPFLVGGERLMYPHDPRASGGNTINCRCLSIPVHPDWEDLAGVAQSTVSPTYGLT